jgi:hypothetical protein
MLNIIKLWHLQNISRASSSARVRSLLSASSSVRKLWDDHHYRAAGHKGQIVRSILIWSVIKTVAHFDGAGFRPFWFAPLGPLPHGPGRRCEAAGASSYAHLGWRASIQSGDLPKKTAPVRARVCAVIVEDSHRLKGGGDACAQLYLTTSQSVEQIHFHLGAASVGGLLHSRYAGRAERPRHSSPGWPPVREKPPGSGRMRRRGDQTEMQFAEVSSYVRLDLPSLRRQSRPKDCSTSPSNPMMEGPWCRFRRQA